MTKVLLYSNGLDSYIISKLWKPDVRIYVDMKTEYAQREIEKLPDDVRIVELPLAQFEQRHSIIPLRNAYLFMVAATVVQDDEIEIALGATQGDRLPDKVPKMCELLNPFFDHMFSGNIDFGKKKVRCVMPYKAYCKEDLVREYLRQGGDIDTLVRETYSCYTPDENGQPCLHCKVCFRNFCSLLVNGWQPTKWQRMKMEEYIQDTILPDIKYMVFGRGRETDTEVKALRMLGYAV